MAKLRFGYFIAPFHRAGTNPTLALQRDLELIEHLDAIGYDEVWIGEHHSAGSEIISSPEVFIAAAAERAKRIRFGTGVISLAYHNPLWAADRLMLLDHLTHGRVIGGVGPGSLPTDSAMIGLTPTDTRELLETNLDIVVRLLAGETVTAKTATHELFDAQLQLAPYADGGHTARRGGGGLADRRPAGRQARHRPAVDRRHPHRRGFRRAGSPLGHRRGTRRRIRHPGRPQELVAGGSHPHRRNRRAGARRRPVRHRAVVPVLPEGRGVPADDDSRRSDRRDDRHHQRSGRRRHRHARAGQGAGAAAVGPVRRVRLHAADGPRMGQSRRHQALRGTICGRSHSALPGSGAADAGRRRASQRRARGPGPDADERHRAHDPEVRGRKGRRNPAVRHAAARRQSSVTPAASRYPRSEP